MSEPPDNPTPTHGKASTYSNWDCRCDLCREAWAAYSRVRRAQRRAILAGYNK